MNTLLVLKLALVPALIAAITLAGRRWGPAVAGWLSAFPVVAGPILLFVALQHGPAFTAEAVAGTFSAILAILVFGLGYAWACTRLPWAPSAACAFAGYALAVAGLGAWRMPLAVAVPAVLGALLLAPRLYPAVAADAPVRALAAPTFDIPLRMVAGALLVWLITHFSTALGPRLSGELAMFPVMGSVLAVFSHRHAGAAFTVRLLRGMVMGYYAFGTFCLGLTLALPRLGLGVAFGGALLAALLVQAATRARLLRLPKPDVAGISPPPVSRTGRAVP